MKHAALIVALCVLLGGCARKSDLDKARAELAEAQKRIEQLETERVPRAQYDVARASLRIADDRIATLEKNLNAAYDILAADQNFAHVQQQIPSASAAPATTAAPTNLQLVNGGYVVSNDTRVYTPDSQLALGEHLQVSSPTGLMVTDTEQRVVGGDLAIKTKGLTMETTDGLLSTQNDGTVKFVGSTLTMKFDEKPGAPNPPAETAAPDTAGQQPPPAPVPANPDTTFVTSSAP